MNKMKKMLAIVLSMIFVITMLAGCGAKKDSSTSKNENVFDVLSNMAKIQKGVVSLEFEMKSESLMEQIKPYIQSDTLALKVEAYAASEKEVVADVSIKMNNEYVEALELVMKDEKIYVNTSKVIDLVEKIMPGQGAAQIKTLIGSDYIVCTMDDIEELMGSEMFSSFAPADLDTIKNAETSANAGLGAMFSQLGLGTISDADAKDYIAIFSDVVGSKVIDTFKNVKPEVLGKSGDKFTFTVSDANIKSIAEEFSAVATKDGMKIYDELLAKLKDKKGESDPVYKMLQENRANAEGIIEDIGSSIKKEEINIGNDKMSMVLGASITGSEGKRSAFIDFTIDGYDATNKEDIMMKLAVTVDESKTKDIVVPENAASLKDVMNIFTGGSAGAEDTGL